MFSRLFYFFDLQIERELILSTDKSGSKVPIKQYPRQIPTTPVAFNRSSISNGNGAASGVIQQFLPKSSTAVAPDHPTPKHAWVSFLNQCKTSENGFETVYMRSCII